MSDDKVEDGDFVFSAITPMEGKLTIHDKQYTANLIADCLKEGVLEMQAYRHNDPIIIADKDGNHIATVDDYTAEESYIDNCLFIEDEPPRYVVVDSVDGVIIKSELIK